MIDNLWVWVLAAYLGGVVTVTVGVIRKFRTDPEMARFRDEDTNFAVAASVLTIVLWPAAPLALPLLRRFIRRFSRR